MHGIMLVPLASPEGTITIDKLESSDTQTLYEASLSEKPRRLDRSSLPLKRHACLRVSQSPS